MKKFESSKLRQLDLTKINGGYGTNTSECTYQYTAPLGNSQGDTEKDGDWVSTC